MYHLATHSLDNRATTACDSDVASSLHEVGSANSLVLVTFVLSQEEVAVALQRVIRATSDLSIAQEQ